MEMLVLLQVDRGISSFKCLHSPNTCPLTHNYPPRRTSKKDRPQRNGGLAQATGRVARENSVLRERGRSPKPRVVGFRPYKMSRTDEPLDSKQTKVAAGGQETGRDAGGCGGASLQYSFSGIREW